MAQPTAFTRQYNFNDFQTTSPSTPLPGVQLDNEFNATKTNLDGLNTNIAKIQRDDGLLANQSVHKNSFDVDALALIGLSGYTVSGNWAASTSYAAGTLVNYNDATYLATVAHTSVSAFATDKAAGKWILLANAAISTTGASVDKFEGTGSQTAFTLSYSYSSNTDMLVFVNGALRNPGDDYTVSGTTLTFSTAPSTPSVSGNENVIIWGANVATQAALTAANTASANASGFANTAQTQAGIATTKAGLTAADALSTAADVVSTNADVVLTHADVALTNADVVSTNADAATTTADRAQVNTDKGIVAADKAIVAADKAIVATDKAAAASSANDAQGSEDEAEKWAQETGGEAVTGQGYSAKAWATGGTGVTNTAGAGHAKDWATKTTGTVDGTESSSKEYAIGTTQAVGSAKQWALGGGGSFTQGTVVAGGLYSARYYADLAQNAASTASGSLSTFQSIWQGSGSSDPTGGTVSSGDLFYNTTDNALKIYVNGAWAVAAVDTSAFSSAGFSVAMAVAL